jgi:hypothetical protein
VKIDRAANSASHGLGQIGKRKNNSLTYAEAILRSIPRLKASAADGTEDIGDSKTLAIAVQTPGEINDASIATTVVDKLEDKKNPLLD